MGFAVKSTRAWLRFSHLLSWLIAQIFHSFVFHSVTIEHLIYTAYLEYTSEEVQPDTCFNNVLFFLLEEVTLFQISIMRNVKYT